VLRSGAKAGDAIFVTGPCGGSILGRHLNPQPRLREIERIAGMVKLTSCIDVSDGLTADLQHILDASGCGAILDADGIPIHPDAFALSQKSGKPALDHALGDGEDFELIFTTSSEDAEKLKGEPHAILIGVCTASGLKLSDSGDIYPIAPKGWSHKFD
jgi:thiamine-monophosphate kinase